MRKTGYKLITYILVMTFLTNFFVIGLAGSTKVEAGLWDEQKGSIFTLVKGLVMLYIMNLISQRANGDSDEGLITSTIRKGLNLDDSDKVEVENDLSSETSKSTKSTELTTDSNNSSVVDDSVDVTDNMNQVEITTRNSISAKEQELVDLVNRARKEQGLQPLEVDKELRQVARIKAEDMVDNDYFEHQSPDYGSPFDMMRQKGIKYSLAGENLAAARTVEKAFEDLMNSPQHKENILEAKYDKIGVGIIEGGDHGLMIVQEFVDSPEITE
ncbi:MAG: CAP domain-containing protein [Halanaerobiales bacterium]|nr:CAP domain-containing protein [Halanaerobiales bacterium]